MNINYYIEEVYNKVRWGDIEYKGRIGNSHYFCNDEQEVCYNILMESISVAEFTNNGKEWVLYLDKNNVDQGIVEYNEYLFSSFLELIIDMVINDSEITRMNNELNDYIQKELFERASKQRDVINNIKIIRSKL